MAHRWKGIPENAQTGKATDSTEARRTAVRDSTLIRPQTRAPERDERTAGGGVLGCVEAPVQIQYRVTELPIPEDGRPQGRRCEQARCPSAVLTQMRRPGRDPLRNQEVDLLVLHLQQRRGDSADRDRHLSQNCGDFPAGVELECRPRGRPQVAAEQDGEGTWDGCRRLPWVDKLGHARRRRASTNNAVQIQPEYKDLSEAGIAEEISSTGEPRLPIPASQVDRAVGSAPHGCEPCRPHNWSELSRRWDRVAIKDRQCRAFACLGRGSASRGGECLLLGSWPELWFPQSAHCHLQVSEQTGSGHPLSSHKRQHLRHRTSVPWKDSWLLSRTNCPPQPPESPERSQSLPLT